jgi:hypothetical protein
MSFILITVSALLVSYGIYRLLRKKEETNVITPEIEETQPEKIVTENVELKIEKVQESTEQLKERLSTITSTDSEKPFATLSKPTLAEIPSEMISPSTDSVEPEVAPKPKKKRPYKKKGPKKETEAKKEN